MTYYSVLDVTPSSEDWIPAYLPIANALVAKHGGKYLARTTLHESLEEPSNSVGLRIILEWPSKDAALAFMNDPEYVPHLNARLNGSDSHHFLIAGQDDLA